MKFYKVTVINMDLVNSYAQTFAECLSDIPLIHLQPDIPSFLQGWIVSKEYDLAIYVFVKSRTRGLSGHFAEYLREVGKLPFTNLAYVLMVNSLYVSRQLLEQNPNG